MSSILAWNNDNALYILLEVTAWIQSRTFSKILSNFISLRKAVIFAIFHQCEPKYDVAHPQYVLYPSVD